MYTSGDLVSKEEFENYQGFSGYFFYSPRASEFTGFLKCEGHSYVISAVSKQELIEKYKSSAETYHRMQKELDLIRQL